VNSLKKCNSTHIFEDNQANLEHAVENLSEMLEQPIDVTTIMQLKADMVNKTNYVEKRAALILQDTLQGHFEVSPYCKIPAGQY
jgi:ariadne-1